jgi:hypothetical protein
MFTVKECLQPGSLHGQGVLEVKEFTQPGSPHIQRALTASEYAHCTSSEWSEPASAK